MASSSNCSTGAPATGNLTSGNPSTGAPPTGTVLSSTGNPSTGASPMSAAGHATRDLLSNNKPGLVTDSKGNQVPSTSNNPLVPGSQPGDNSSHSRGLPTGTSSNNYQQAAANAAQSGTAPGLGALSGTAAANTGTTSNTGMYGTPSTTGTSGLGGLAGTSTRDIAPTTGTTGTTGTTPSAVDPSTQAQSGSKMQDVKRAVMEKVLGQKPDAQGYHSTTGTGQ